MLPGLDVFYVLPLACLSAVVALFVDVLIHGAELVEVCDCPKCRHLQPHPSTGNLPIESV